jgi:energy-coupling factor transport system substrate-specific component
MSAPILSPEPVAKRPGTLPRKTWVIAFVPLGIALNLTLGTIVHTLRLPVYLDAVGTIIVTLLAGWRAGVITGVGSFLLGGILMNPVLPWFSGTQAAIAIYVAIMANLGGFKSFLRTALSGLGMGIVAGIVSAPVIAYLFGGVTGAGPSVVTAFLLATGRTLVKAVLLSGLACEPIDKMLQCLLAFWIIKGIPPTLLARIGQSKLMAVLFCGV